jgi:hypothetical protein
VIRPRGESLLELIVGLAIFSVLVLTAFDVFALGTSTFQLTSGRLGLQGEIRRINGALRRDILSSCFTSISSFPQAVNVSATPPSLPMDQSAARDAISFASMADSGNTVCYNTSITPYNATTGLSQFGCWTVYCPYTNPANVYDCKLYRYHCDYHPGSASQLPLSPTSWAGVLWSPAQSTTFTDIHCYSDQILSFEILPNPGDQTLQVTIKLMAPLGHISTGKKQTAEIVESAILLKSENTWPKL